jgi:hypothetical protein
MSACERQNAAPTVHGATLSINNERDRRTWSAESKSNFARVYTTGTFLASEARLPTSSTALRHGRLGPLTALMHVS